MELSIREKNGFRYLDEGEGPVVIILHGLFGALSNFADVVNRFSGQYRMMIPLMPIYEGKKFKATVTGLADFLEAFVDSQGIERFSLLGNSLGGHIALVYTLNHPRQIETLTLTGSSGLYETGMGSSFPRRGSYEFIRERVAFTFYSPETATKELVDEVYEIVNNNMKALRILRFARSAQNHNMRDEVTDISVPTLLIWGLNDTITPPRVGHEFDRLIPKTELHFIDKCGHAPMMEQPQEFNRILARFLKKHLSVPA